MLTLTAIINKLGTDTMDTITAEGADYAAAETALHEKLPDGWRMYSIRRW